MDISDCVLVVSKEQFERKEGKSQGEEVTMGMVAQARNEERNEKGQEEIIEKRKEVDLSKINFLHLYLRIFYKEMINQKMNQV